MLNTTRRRLGSSALLAAGLVILVPALAEAQLFPNRTIQREKPNCATEPPFYKQVRRDYFGYYPTCWSRFPEGWGCPCPDPELQQFRDKYASEPPDTKRKPANSDDGTGAPKDPATDDMNPDGKPKTGDEKLPILPTTPSPFLMDTEPSKPGTGPPPSRPTTPGNPGASLSPGAPSMLNDMPALPSTSPVSGYQPTGRPGSIAMYPDDATLTSNNSNDRPDLGPLPAAPTPAPYTPGTGVGFVSASTPTSNGAETVLGTPIPAQAPKRRSLLSQLFGRNNAPTQNR